MALSAGRKGVASDQVDSLGKIKGLDIPIATPSKAGTVKPVSKTAEMTQDVGIDSAGKLYTEPGASEESLTLLLNLDNIYSSTEYDLNDSIANYSKLYCVGVTSYSGVKYVSTNTYYVDLLSIGDDGDGIGVYNESTTAWVQVISNTKVKGLSISLSSPRYFKIYGIK